MPITKQHLINNTSDFVRDYVYSMDHTVPRIPRPPDGPQDNEVGYNANRFRATLTDRVTEIPATPKWFNVIANPGPIRMGPGGMDPVHAEMVAIDNPPVGMPGGRLNNRAYLLPWGVRRLCSMPLGNEANFFFTSPLSGCKIYIHRQRNRNVTVYHANSQGVARPEDYMNLIFEAKSGQQVGNQNVSTYNSAGEVNIYIDATNPIAMRMADRKKSRNLKHGRRRDVRWLASGANVMGVRTQRDGWTFYYQRFGYISYRKPAFDFNVKRWGKTGKGHTTPKLKLTTVEVIESGVVM